MIPQDFAAASRRFDHAPEDAELVWLLGEIDHPGDVKVVETTRCLSVAPGLIPMKFVVPWVLFTGAVISAMPWIAPHIGFTFEGPLAWGCIITMWLLIMPAILSILAALNNHFDQGDYFRVDKIQRKLELPSEGLHFQENQIIAVTELSKWCLDSIGDWEWTRQIGVLLKGADGQIEHRFLVREIYLRWWRRRLADQIAEVFQVPVRRLKLSFRESRNLTASK